MADKRPIGVFDSGLGGLTVVKEIIKELETNVEEKNNNTFCNLTLHFFIGHPEITD